MLVSTQTPIFLGFVVDSVETCFLITEKKRQSFRSLREEILSKTFATVLDLQKLCGTAVSFMIVVPAAKLYTREINLAISYGIKHDSKVEVSDPLNNEIQSWRFLDTWVGWGVGGAAVGGGSGGGGRGKADMENRTSLPNIELSSDASLFKYGGIFHLPTGKVTVSDFWCNNHNVLEAVKRDLSGKRVDAHVDNQVLIKAWNNEGCK